MGYGFRVVCNRLELATSIYIHISCYALCLLTHNAGNKALRKSTPRHPTNSWTSMKGETGFLGSVFSLGIEFGFFFSIYIYVCLSPLLKTNHNIRVLQSCKQLMRFMWEEACRACEIMKSCLQIGSQWATDLGPNRLYNKGLVSVWRWKLYTFQN